MATIYKFQDETSLTVPPAAADQLLVYSSTAAHARAVTAPLAVMAAVSVTSITSASTGTNLLPYGISVLTSSNNSLGYLLSPPTSPGFKTTIVANSTAAPTVTSSAAVIVTLGSSAIVTMTFNTVKGARVTLESLSTAVWLHSSSTTTAHAALS